MPTFVILILVMAVIVIAILLLQIDALRQDLRREIVYNTSDYFVLKRTLEAELKIAKFNRDWKKKQIIALDLLWLDILAESKYGNSTDNEKLSRLSISESHHDPWSYENHKIVAFCTRILNKFSNVTMEVIESGKNYVPVNLLPYPKEEIKKALSLLKEYQIFKMADTGENNIDIIKSIQVQHSLLETIYTDPEEP